MAESALSAALGPSVFERSDVEARPDHDGEEALFVTVHFKPGVESANPEALTDALVSLRNALQNKGDDRFPYFQYHFPGDERPLAEEAGASVK